MRWSDILILIAVGFNTYWLIKETNFLKGKIKTQSEFIEDVKKIVEIYRTPIADHERIVQLVRESAEADKLKAIEQVEQEVKDKTIKDIHVLRTEYEALLNLTMEFVGAPEIIHYTKIYLDRMDDNAISKKYLIGLYEKNYPVWAELDNGILSSLISRIKTKKAKLETKAAEEEIIKQEKEKGSF